MGCLGPRARPRIQQPSDDSAKAGMHSRMRCSEFDEFEHTARSCMIRSQTRSLTPPAALFMHIAAPQLDLQSWPGTWGGMGPFDGTGFEVRLADAEHCGRVIVSSANCAVAALPAMPHLKPPLELDARHARACHPKPTCN